MAVKPHVADPATEYDNVDQKIKSRAPHDQYLYGAGNNTLWNILHDDLKDHPSYTSIQSFARTQNDRATYLALSLHYLGRSPNDTVLKEAEDNLNNVFYTEEKLKFTFDRFVEIHRSTQNDMLLVPDYVVLNLAARLHK